MRVLSFCDLCGPASVSTRRARRTQVSCAQPGLGELACSHISGTSNAPLAFNVIWRAARGAHAHGREGELLSTHAASADTVLTAVTRRHVAHVVRRHTYSSDHKSGLKHCRPLCAQAQQVGAAPTATNDADDGCSAHLGADRDRSHV